VLSATCFQFSSVWREPIGGEGLGVVSDLIQKVVSKSFVPFSTYLLRFSNGTRNKHYRTVFHVKFESFRNGLFGRRQYVITIHKTEFSFGASIVVGILKDGRDGNLGIFIMTEDRVVLSRFSFAKKHIPQFELVLDIDSFDLTAVGVGVGVGVWCVCLCASRVCK